MHTVLNWEELVSEMAIKDEHKTLLLNPRKVAQDGDMIRVALYRVFDVIALHSNSPTRAALARHNVMLGATQDDSTYYELACKTDHQPKTNSRLRRTESPNKQAGRMMSIDEVTKQRPDDAGRLSFIRSAIESVEAGQ